MKSGVCRFQSFSPRGRRGLAAASARRGTIRPSESEIARGVMGLQRWSYLEGGGGLG